MMEENKYYSQQGISNSSLAWINPEQTGSPLKFKTMYIDGEREELNTPSLENGKLIHKYVEDRGSFKISDLTKPSEMMSLWIERAYEVMRNDYSLEDIINNPTAMTSEILSVRDGAYTKMKDDTVIAKFWGEGSEYLTYLYEKEDKFILSTSQQKIITSCIDSINSSNKAHELLFKEPDFDQHIDAYNELPIFWEKTTTSGQVLPCKSLLDRVKVHHIDGGVVIQLIDFKTTAKPVLMFKNTFEFYRYYRQLAFYKQALLSHFKDLNVLSIECYIVAVETTGLHECKTFFITEDWIKKGDDEVTELTDTLAYHYASGQWSKTREEVEFGTIAIPFEPA